MILTRKSSVAVREVRGGMSESHQECSILQGYHHPPPPCNLEQPLSPRHPRGLCPKKYRELHLLHLFKYADIRLVPSATGYERTWINYIVLVDNGVLFEIWHDIRGIVGKIEIFQIIIIPFGWTCISSSDVQLKADATHEDAIAQPIRQEPPLHPQPRSPRFSRFDHLLPHRFRLLRRRSFRNEAGSVRCLECLSRGARGDQSDIHLDNPADTGSTPDERMK